LRAYRVKSVVISTLGKEEDEDAREEEEESTIIEYM